MKTYWGVEVQLHAFSTSVLYWGWVNPSGRLDPMEKKKFLPLPEIEPRAVINFENWKQQSKST
jgi:hypothetical protein